MSRSLLPPVVAAVATLALTARHASAAPTLVSLGSPSLQTLIALGADGVTVGDLRFYDFTYAATAGAPTVDAVQVQAASSGGLRFFGNWFANDGATISSTISYDVATLDDADIVRLALTSNGTAPQPAAHTFVTTTAFAATPAGSAAGPVLSTFDDGHTAPIDTTAPDVNADVASFGPSLTSMSVTNTVTASSGPNGLATASLLQNAFAVATVPEPTGALALPAVALAWGQRRRVRAKESGPVGRR